MADTPVVEVNVDTSEAVKRFQAVTEAAERAESAVSKLNTAISMSGASLNPTVATTLAVGLLLQEGLLSERQAVALLSRALGNINRTEAAVLLGIEEKPGEAPSPEDKAFAQNVAREIAEHEQVSREALQAHERETRYVKTDGGISRLARKHGIDLVVVPEESAEAQAIQEKLERAARLSLILAGEIGKGGPDETPEQALVRVLKERDEVRGAIPGAL